MRCSYACATEILRGQENALSFGAVDIVLSFVGSGTGRAMYYDMPILCRGGAAAGCKTGLGGDILVG